MFRKENNNEIKDLKNEIKNLEGTVEKLRKELASNNLCVVDTYGDIQRKVSRLLEIWEPDPKKVEKKLEDLKETKEQKAQNRYGYEGITLINFSKKYNYDIDQVKARCKKLRIDAKITPDMYIMGFHGKRKVLYLSSEAERILLEFMKKQETLKVEKPKKKKLTDMTREELIKEIYKKNQIIKRK